jgi:hypothetical protein
MGCSNLVVLGVKVYNAPMPNNLEILENDSKSVITADVRSAFIPANRAVVAADRGGG